MIPRAPVALARSLLWDRTSATYLILFVTGRCNARCELCFYWDNIVAADRKRELTLDELERISRGFSNLPYLTLTGGEPFLREDLPDIAEAFYRQSGVQFFVIPTNGLTPERNREAVEAIVSRCPRAYLKIQLSIDGVGEDHDRQRGVPGNFERMMETYRELDGLRRRYRNFNLDVSTILSPENIDGLFPLVQFIESNLEVENHNVALARPDSRRPVDPTRLYEAYQRWQRYREEKRQRADRRPLARLFRSIYEENMAVLQQTLERDEMVLPCHAGRKMLVIGEYGDVYPCEPLHRSIGNLREFDYDVGRILATPEARELVHWIVDSRCHCTWECAVQTNIVFNRRTYPRLLKRMLKARRGAEIPTPSGPVPSEGYTS